MSNEAPQEEENPSDERLPLTELESLSARPPSWGKRRVQLALLALAFCVALVALWSAIAPAQRQGRLPGAAPMLAPAPTLLVSNLTNAIITFNGKKLAGHPPLLVPLSLESDVVTIAAPSFHPYTCHFKGLNTRGDPTHCLLTTNNIPQVSQEFILGIYLTPDDLLPAQRAQVLAPIMQQLAVAQQAPVQPGEYIATAFDQTGSITSQRAAAALQASATFVQSAAEQSTAYLSFSPACGQLICPAGIGPDSFTEVPNGLVWDLLLKVALRWHFTDSSGAPVADVTYPSDPLRFRQPTFLQIRFLYGATGWHLSADINITSEMQTALCQTGVWILNQRLLQFSIFDMQPPHDAGVNGCLISIQAAGKTATILWRFGVLLAADSGAHALFSDLPIAPPAEINAVGG